MFSFLLFFFPLRGAPRGSLLSKATAFRCSLLTSQGVVACHIAPSSHNCHLYRVSLETRRRLLPAGILWLLDAAVEDDKAVDGALDENFLVFVAAFEDDVGLPFLELLVLFSLLFLFSSGGGEGPEEEEDTDDRLLTRMSEVAKFLRLDSGLLLAKALPGLALLLLILAAPLGAGDWDLLPRGDVPRCRRSCMSSISSFCWRRTFSLFSSVRCSNSRSLSSDSQSCFILFRASAE